MRDLAVHESGAVIDLVEPTAEHEALMRVMLAERDARRRTPKGILRCAAHDAPLYLQVREAVVYACHWPGTGLGKHRVSLMSTEHRVQVEYVARAADRAGIRTALEVSLPTHVRPDLVIGDRTAIEVQRSHLTVRQAKSRTTKAINGGMDISLWISDKEPKYAPKWMYQVPSATAFAREWDTLPPAGSATITSGVRELIAEPCRPPYRTQCPETKRTWCGKQHVRHLPLRGVSLDVLSVGLVGGEFVPALVGGHLLIAREDEVRRYGVAWKAPHASEPVETKPSPERIECHGSPVVQPSAIVRPMVDRRALPQQWCQHWIGAQQRYCNFPNVVQYINGRFCDNHSPAAMRELARRESIGA